MDLDWNAIGAIAELLAAAGVVASLVYLARQLGRTARVEIASGFQRSIDSLHPASGNLLRGDLAELYRAGAANYDALSESDRLRFHVLVAGLVDRLDTALEFERLGIVPSNYFKQGGRSNFTKFMEQLFFSPGVQRWWQLEKQFYSPEFQRWVDERREPEGPLTPLAVHRS